MLTKWNEYWKQIESCDKELNDFLENGGLSSIALSKARKFLSAWSKQKKMAYELDQYISPVEPLLFELPFQSEQFAEMWSRWKDYLSEQHGQLLKSRSEKSALEHLYKLSKGNDDVAVDFLRYAMANRYRNFFYIEAVDTKQPAKGEGAKGSAFD